MDRFVELLFDSGESFESAAVSVDAGSDSFDSFERLDLEVVLFFLGSSSVLLAAGVVEVELSAGFTASAGLLRSGLAVSTGFVSSADLAVASPDSLVVAVSSDFDFEREERDLEDDRFEVFSFGFSLSLPVREPAAAASPVVVDPVADGVVVGDEGSVAVGLGVLGTVTDGSVGEAVVLVLEVGGGTSDGAGSRERPSAFADGSVAGFAAGFAAGVIFFFAGVAANAADVPRLSPAGPIRRQAESDTATSGCQASSDTNNDRRLCRDEQLRGLNVCVSSCIFRSGLSPLFFFVQLICFLSFSFRFFLLTQFIKYVAKQSVRRR